MPLKITTQNGRAEEERMQKYKIVRDLLQEATTLFKNTYLLDMFEYAPKNKSRVCG